MVTLADDIAYIQKKFGDGPLTHDQIVYGCQYVCGRMPGVVVWVNPVGSGEVKGGRYVTWGLATGSSDLICIVAPGGRFVAMEAKSGNARPDTKQRAFINLVRAHGGVAGVVRSIEDAIELVEQAREKRCKQIPT